jgi:hypothetical protein
LGAILTGILSAELEEFGMQNHPYGARVLAGILVLIAFYTRAWLRLLVAMSAALICLAFLRSWQKKRSR